MDILRVLSTPDLEVRKKTLQLALDLVSSRNVEEVSGYTARFFIHRLPVCCQSNGVCLCRSWWLFWRKRWSRQTMWANTKTRISTGSCWCARSTPAACASLTWRPMSYLWWVSRHSWTDFCVHVYTSENFGCWNPSQLMEFLSDTNEAAAADVLEFVREAIQRFDNLRPLVIEKMLEVFHSIKTVK